MNIEKDRVVIAKKLEEYVTCILKEYKEVIPSHIKEKLLSVNHFLDLVKIENTGTISLYVREGIVYLPFDAYEVLEKLSHLPQFGLDKNHKTYQEDTMILNDNTYLTFVEHVILKGLTPCGYFEEILLHETMHLCGSGGSYALFEGFNELKTREIALKYHLKTSCCGYPKETKIAYLLQELWGKDIGDKLAFSSLSDSFYLLKEEFGEEASRLYIDILLEMEKQFENYRKKQYPGIEGIKNKCLEYDKIDYEKVYELIHNYQLNQDSKEGNKRP